MALSLLCDRPAAPSLDLDTAMHSTCSSSPLSSIPTSPGSTLTEFSRSPSPALDDSSIIRARKYMTPPSTQGSSPSPDATVDSAADRDAEVRPAKRRKLSSTPRTTEHLDLRSESSIEGQEAQLNKLLKVLHKRRKIVVIAGAGISVSAGSEYPGSSRCGASAIADGPQVPDFRSSTGLFKSLKNEHNLKSSGKALFDASVYKDAESTSTFHEMVRTMSQSTKAAHPTPFHHLLATLAHEGRLLRLYSQNVDGIDTALPPLATQVPLRKENGVWPKTVQVHGSLHNMVCAKCHFVADLNPDLFDGPIAPNCPTCEQQDTVRTEHAGKRSHGIGKLRPRMVLYNEQGHAFDDEAIGDVMQADLRSRPDALIVVGTSFKIPGTRRIAYEMSQTVRDRRDGLTVWINLDSAPADKKLEWDVVVKGPCDEVARHAAMRKWNEESVQFVDESDEFAVKQDNVQVVVGSPAKSRLVQQMPTPVASPNLGASKTKVVPLFDKKPKAALAKGDQFLKKTTKTSKSTTAAKAAPRKSRPKKVNTNNTKLTGAFKVSKVGTTSASAKLNAKPAPDTTARTVPSTKASKENTPPRAAGSDPMELHLAKSDACTSRAATDRYRQRPSTPRRELAAVSPFDARQNASTSLVSCTTDDERQRVLWELSTMAPVGSPLTGHRARSEGDACAPVSPTLGARRSASLHERRRSETISPPGAPRGMRGLID